MNRKELVRILNNVKSDSVRFMPQGVFGDGLYQDLETGVGVSVSTKVLKRWLKASKSEDVSLSTSGELSSCEGQVQLQVVDPLAVPEMPTPEMFPLDFDISRLLWAVYAQTDRPAWRTVIISNGYALASNGYLACRVPTQCPDVTIPLDTATRMAKMHATSVGSDGDTILVKGDGWVSLADTFAPPSQDVWGLSIKQAPNRTASLCAKSVLQAVRMAKITNTEYVDLVVGETVELRNQDCTVGAGGSPIIANTTRFSPSYLEKVIKATGDCTYSTQLPRQAALFESDIAVVLMPVFTAS